MFTEVTGLMMAKVAFSFLYGFMSVPLKQKKQLVADALLPPMVAPTAESENPAELLTWKLVRQAMHRDHNAYITFVLFVLQSRNGAADGYAILQAANLAKQLATLRQEFFEAMPPQAMSLCALCGRRCGALPMTVTSIAVQVEKGA